MIPWALIFHLFRLPLVYGRDECRILIIFLKFSGDNPKENVTSLFLSRRGPPCGNVTLETLSFAAYWVVCRPEGWRPDGLLVRYRPRAAFE